MTLSLGFVTNFTIDSYFATRRVCGESSGHSNLSIIVIATCTIVFGYHGLGYFGIETSYPNIHDRFIYLPVEESISILRNYIIPIITKIKHPKKVLLTPFIIPMLIRKILIIINKVWILENYS